MLLLSGMFLYPFGLFLIFCGMTVLGVICSGVGLIAVIGGIFSR